MEVISFKAIARNRLVIFTKYLEHNVSSLPTLPTPTSLGFEVPVQGGSGHRSSSQRGSVSSSSDQSQIPGKGPRGIQIHDQHPLESLAQVKRGLPRRTRGGGVAHPGSRAGSAASSGRPGCWAVISTSLSESMRFPLYRKVSGIRTQNLGPDWCGSVGGVSSCKLKGCWFDSQSGHMPGLRVQFPMGVDTRGNQLMSLTSIFLSLTFSLPSLHSKNK